MPKKQTEEKKKTTAPTEKITKTAGKKTVAPADRKPVGKAASAAKEAPKKAAPAAAKTAEKKAAAPAENAEKKKTAAEETAAKAAPAAKEASGKQNLPAENREAGKRETRDGYGNDSIDIFEGPDRIRKRPSVIFGSSDLNGCKQGFFEILANAIDESNAGYGKEIRTTVFLDHSIEVEDFGRGVPMGFNERIGRWNWDLVFCELYSGGKMNNKTDKSAYKCSLGTNGMGACATQCASVYMTVDSFDGKNDSFIRFERGFATSELQSREIRKGEKKTGTVIRWLPDLEVFTDIDIPVEYFRDVLHRQAAVNYGVRFVLSAEQPDHSFVTEEYFYPAEQGLGGYLHELTGDLAVTETVIWHSEATGRDREDKEDYYAEADYAFCFTQASGQQEFYHNSSWLEHGGSPENAVESAFGYAIDKYIRTSGKYNKNESKIKFQDIADSLVIVISSHSDEASYENQTKKAINNPFIEQMMTDFLKKQLDIYFVEHPNEANKLSNQILINKRSRENAEKAKIDIKKKLSGTMDASSRVEKFVNCRSKDPNERELFIVEGDSALTSCKLGRAAEFQAIIPVRGKTLNCLKSDYKKIFDNEIVLNLLRVIGCGVELDANVKAKKSDIATFSLDSLRWAKIIICTDADEDGYQIRTLLLTLFYRLLPTLLQERKVFIAESPLFEISCKDKTFFAFNEQEKVEILKKIGDQKCTIQRSKGLGENEPEMMWETTMNPATRRLVAVTPTDARETASMFEMLLGDDIQGRKRFIAEHGAEYMKDADIQ